MRLLLLNYEMLTYWRYCHAFRKLHNKCRRFSSHFRIFQLISYLSISIFRQMISTWQNYGSCFIEIGQIKIFKNKTCKICFRFTKQLKCAKECIKPLFSFRYSATVCKPLDDNLVNVWSEQFLCKWHLLFFICFAYFGVKTYAAPNCCTWYEIVE